MTKLDNLIAELCQDGVEYKPLGEVARYSSGRVSAAEMTAENYVGVDNLLPDKQGKALSDYVPLSGMLTRYEPSDILIGNIRPYLKKIWLSDRIGGTNGDVLVIHITQDNLLSEFLYYLLSSEQFFSYATQHSKGGKMPRGSKDAVMRYSIPIPPLLVQHEIVRILDNFTELTAELTAELATELTTRKKQYEYYRNFLIYNSEVNRVPFDTVISLQRGYDLPKNKMQNGEYPVIGSNGIIGWHNDYTTDSPSITVGRSGSVGKVFIYKGRSWSHNTSLYVKNLNGANPYFIYHLLQTLNLPSYGKGGSVPTLNRNDLRNILIPIPSLEKQARIVEILDRFDTLITDITNGLPAEITARQKQYEYYRDKLLSFPAKQTSIS